MKVWKTETFCPLPLRATMINQNSYQCTYFKEMP